MNEALIEFYTDVGTDAEGRTHADILAFDDDTMEGCHDFIQWLFPTATPSAYNPNAPLLDEETIDNLKGDAAFEAKFRSALNRIFKFWELDFGGFYPNNNHAQQFRIAPITRKKFWMEYDDHNLLRMTRVMESCALLGFTETAQSLFQALLDTVKLEPSFYFIEPVNIYYWYNACHKRIN